MGRGRKLQKGDEAVTDFNGKGVVRVAITDRRENAQSQSRVMYRVWPPLKGGNNETWYDADWFEPAPPNAIGQRGAASGASDAPTGCASNGDTEEE